MLKLVCLGLFLIFSVVASSQEIPASTGSSLLHEEAKAALDFHNEIRKDLGVPPLEWSQELSKYAQAWADQLAADRCKPRHRPPDGEWELLYGENIFWGSSPSFTPLDASKKWYWEMKDFTYGPVSRENLEKTGHYTQMVWRNTTKLGMGMKKCPNGGLIIVANYDPSGNFLGQKPY